MIILEIFFAYNSENFTKLNLQQFLIIWSPKGFHLIFSNITTEVLAAVMDLADELLVSYS